MRWLAARAIERVLASDKLDLVGLHAHIGSQIFELEPYRLAIAALGELAGDWCGVVDVGGGLGVAYTADDAPPAIDDYVGVKVEGVREVFGPDVRMLIEPGRSLVANAGVTAYRVGTVKEIPGIRTYVAVDGGMSDNLRPMLYGSRYEVLIADRAAAEPDTLVTVAGMHCESGDVLVRDAMLAAPAVGDVLVTPATGAYGHAMANNYNGVTRPPVIFCSRRRGPRRRPPRDLRRPDGARCLRCSAAETVVEVGEGPKPRAHRPARPRHRRRRLRRAARRARRRGRGGDRPAPRAGRGADPQRGRLRRDPRALRPGGRADGRDRTGARVRRSPRCAPGGRSSPPTSSCSRRHGDELFGDRPRAGRPAALRGGGGGGDPDRADDPGGLRGDRDRARSTGSSTAPPTSSSARWPRPGRATTTSSPAPRSSATPRPIPPTTSPAPTRRRRWRSSRGSPSTPR